LSEELEPDPDPELLDPLPDPELEPELDGVVAGFDELESVLVDEDDLLSLLSLLSLVSLVSLLSRPVSVEPFLA
jgi:hypothetical protein